MQFVGLGATKLHFFFSLCLREQEVVVLFLFAHFVMLEIGHDVGLTQVNKHIVFNEHRPNSLGKHAVADAKIFNEETVRLVLVADLKLAAGVLFLVFFFADGDDEVVYNLFVILGILSFKRSAGRSA